MKKKLVAALLVSVGLIGLAWTIAPVLGLMSVTQAAFNDYPTEFDPSNSSDFCQNTNPEFEPITENKTFQENGSVWLAQKPRAVCGISDAATLNPTTNSLFLPSFIANSNRVKTTDLLGRGVPTGYQVWVVERQVKAIGAVTGGTNGNSCYLNSTSGKHGVISDGVCYFDQPALLQPSSPYSWSGYQMVVEETRKNGTKYHRVAATRELVTENKMTNDSIQITYAVPRPTIPSYLHFRKYSCPLESGHYLTAQTFTEGEQINKDSFAYKPNYFCKRHGVIKTQLATQRSVESTQEYIDIVNGKTLTVPEGETWTFFYVPRVDTAPPVKCKEGDYYDVETEKCVKLVSGFVYVCTDPETHLIGNQCVKEANLKIVCPKGAELIGGKCYLAGETVITCPQGYTKAGNKCYKQGELVTECPEGYELKNGACYIQGKNIIQCPDGYDLQNNKCYKRGELITECPSGYTLKNGACYIMGTQNMVCPDGTHKETINNEERCIIDSTYCPTGYSKQGGKCVKEGETICPKGTIKISTDTGFKCQRTETVCPKGSIEINNECVKEGKIVCPEGTQKNEKGECVQEPIELPNVNLPGIGLSTLSLIAGAILFKA